VRWGRVWQCEAGGVWKEAAGQVRHGKGRHEGAGGTEEGGKEEV